MGPVASIPPEISRRIRGLSLLACALVVLNHAHNLDPGMVGEGAWWTTVAWMQNGVSSGFSKITTPFFFLVAAYLLFHGLAGDHPFAARIRKRWSSLAVPFLAWSVLGLGALLAMQLVGMGSRAAAGSLSAWQWLELALWNPVPYQLWFVRCLVVLCLLAPLIHLLVRRRATATALMAGLVALWCLWPDVRETRAALFFCLGACGAVHGLRVPVLAGWQAAAFAALWTTMVAISTAHVVAHGVVHPVIGPASIPVGLATLWCGYPWLARWLDRPAAQRLAVYTFFVYASHEPFESVLSRVAAQAFGPDPAGLLVAWLATATLTFGTCLVIAWLLERHLPALFAILSGGRGRSARGAAPSDGKRVAAAG